MVHIHRTGLFKVWGFPLLTLPVKYYADPRDCRSDTIFDWPSLSSAVSSSVVTHTFSSGYAKHVCSKMEKANAPKLKYMLLITFALGIM